MRTINFKSLSLSSVAIAMLLLATSCTKEPCFPPKEGGKGGGGIIIVDDSTDNIVKPPVIEYPGEDELPKDPANPNECGFEGELFWPVDGCNLSIKLADESWLYPINQDKLAGLKIGDKVRFGYVYKHDAITNCMGGYNIKITCLQVLNNN